MTLPFVLVLLAGLPAQPTSNTGPVAASRPSPIQITVRCYNRLRPALRAPAERALTRVARAGGLEWTLAWQGCFDESNRKASAAPQSAAGPRVLRLTIAILPPAMARPLESDEDQMGMTPRSSVATSGRLAYVFYDRVEHFAHSHETGVGLLLAAAIAHEVGHMLLPYPAHAPMGLMRATWTLKEFQEIAMGWLLFTPSQAAVLRQSVSRARPSDDARGRTEGTQ
jgi:hypothetical protein